MPQSDFMPQSHFIPQWVTFRATVRLYATVTLHTTLSHTSCNSHTLCYSHTSFHTKSHFMPRSGLCYSHNSYHTESHFVSQSDLCYSHNSYHIESHFASQSNFMAIQSLTVWLLDFFFPILRSSLSHTKNWLHSWKYHSMPAHKHRNSIEAEWSKNHIKLTAHYISSTRCLQFICRDVLAWHIMPAELCGHWPTKMRVSRVII